MITTLVFGWKLARESVHILHMSSSRRGGEQQILLFCVKLELLKKQNVVWVWVRGSPRIHRHDGKAHRAFGCRVALQDRSGYKLRQANSSWTLSSLYPPLGELYGGTARPLCGWWIPRCMEIIVSCFREKGGA